MGSIAKIRDFCDALVADDSSRAFVTYLTAAVLIGASSCMFINSGTTTPTDFSSEPTIAGSQIREDTKVTLPASGDVLLIGGWSKGNKSTTTAEFYDTNTGKFNKTGSLDVSSGAGVAALIASGPDNGEILAAGGFGGSSKFTHKTLTNLITGVATNNLQLYTPATGLFGAASSLLYLPRVGATATTLNTGSVLITGGADQNGNPTDTAAVFDAASGTLISTTNNMSAPRAFHSATLLNDGRVLVAGGGTDSIGDLTGTADIYDPATNSFTATTGAMVVPRAAHATALLTTGPSAGQVLLVGGAQGGSVGLFANFVAELFNPTTGLFSTLGAGATNDARAFATATALPDGTVLVAGGFSTFFLTAVNGATGLLQNTEGFKLNSAELYDPNTGMFTCIGGTTGVVFGPKCSAVMKKARAAHTATLFSSGPLAGQVLIAGGVGGAKTTKGNSTELSEAELYDPGKGTFVKTGKMKEARGFHSAVLLP